MARAGVSRGSCVAQLHEIPVGQCWKVTRSPSSDNRPLALLAPAKRPTTSTLSRTPTEHPPCTGTAGCWRVGDWELGPTTRCIVDGRVCGCVASGKLANFSPQRCCQPITGLAGAMGRTQTPLVILKSSKQHLPRRGSSAWSPSHPDQWGWASGRNPLGDSAKWEGVATQDGEEPQEGQAPLGTKGLAHGSVSTHCRGTPPPVLGPMDSDQTLPGEIQPWSATCPEPRTRNLGGDDPALGRAAQRCTHPQAAT